MKKLAFTISRVVTAGALVLALAPLAHAEDPKIPVKGVTFALEIPGTFVGQQAGPNFIAYREMGGAIFPCSTFLQTDQFFGCTPGVNTNGFFAIDPLIGFGSGFGTMHIEESAQRIARGRFYNALAKQTINGQIWDANGPLYFDCAINLTVTASGDLLPGPITTASAANISGHWVITSGTCADGVRVTGHGTLGVQQFDQFHIPVYEGEINIHTSN